MTESKTGTDLRDDAAFVAGFQASGFFA